MEVLIVCGRAHQPTARDRGPAATHQGRYVAQCPCGWVGPAYPYEDEALSAAAIHIHNAKADGTAARERHKVGLVIGQAIQWRQTFTTTKT